MPRNRYQMILRIIHFNDNESPTMLQGDRLRKLNSSHQQIGNQVQTILHTRGESMYR